MLELTAWAALAAAAVLGLLLYRLRGEAAAQARRLDLALQSLEQLQRAFGRFAPQEVVEQIIARGIAGAGEKKEVTVLFADLKGFTRMSEGLDPAVLVKILNDYFSRMSMAISEYIGAGRHFRGGRSGFTIAAGTLPGILRRLHLDLATVSVLSSRSPLTWRGASDQ